MRVLRRLLDGTSIYDYWSGIAATRSDAARHPRVVEIGVHHGDDTARLTRTSPTGGLDWVGFEPDPRNLAVLTSRGLEVVGKAVSDVNGQADFWLSGGWTPGSEGTRWHTDSSSLNPPTGHLAMAPWCRFDERTTVGTIRLDTALRDQGDRRIDLLWVDVQGAQRGVIAGASETLRRTRYLYIECHPAPLYEGEPTFDELCALLPDFVVVKRWHADVLLRHRTQAAPFNQYGARVAALEVLASLAWPVRELRRWRRG